MKRVRYAFVEFQPDLQDPRSPVFLGCVVARASSRGFEFAIVGREPTRGQRPPELNDVGSLTIRSLSSWMLTAAEVIRHCEGDVFDALARKFRWNLYITEPTEKHAGKGLPLVVVAERLCQRRLGITEPLIRDRSHLPAFGDHALPAWMIESVRDRVHCRAA